MEWLDFYLICLCVSACLTVCLSVSELKSVERKGRRLSVLDFGVISRAQVKVNITDVEVSAFSECFLLCIYLLTTKNF